MTPLVRPLWHLLEPIHAALYYAPEAFAVAADLGYSVDTRWPSYFAWRSAPLGSTGANLVAATFYSFSRRMVAEYVPDVWSVADPTAVLDARLAAVDRALSDRLRGLELAESAEIARRAAESIDVGGRPLAAANADLPWPTEAHLVLWQAATILREHRGDGHVAALLGAGLDPCESLVSFAAVGAARREVFASRGWSDEEWSAAASRLTERGWLDSAGAATERGREGRIAVERRTDELAAGPWRAIGQRDCERLARLLTPPMKAVVSARILPRGSTLGIGKVAV